MTPAGQRTCGRRPALPAGKQPCGRPQTPPAALPRANVRRMRAAAADGRNRTTISLPLLSLP